jgi:para-nitrobenzyl esterase
VCPSYFIAESISEKTNKNVWFYSFDKVRDGKKSKEMGAYHGAELPYVFNTHDYWLPTSESDNKITKAIQGFWLNFIQKGNPNSFEDIWKEFQPSLFNVLSFDEDTSMIKSTSIDVCKELGYIKY